MLYKWLMRIIVALGLLYISFKIGMAGDLEGKLFGVLCGVVWLIGARRAGVF